MKLGVGRVVKAEQAAVAERVQLEPEAETLPRGELVRAEVLAAAERAAALIAQAELRATEIVQAAERSAAELCLRVEAEARADAAASIAARALALLQRENSLDERGLARTVELARILAERLLGESLRVAPEQILALARQALSEARGARRITLVAHPSDAELLSQSLPALGLEPDTARVVADAARAPGNLRIETELGVLDAELAPQLQRLALKLRESLSHE
jgi:flagellar biosynthesis/type III secretory pathway protein FliH